MSEERTLDRHISAVESGDWSRCPCFDCMRNEHNEALEAGLLDEDQPTRFSHHTEVQRMTRPFTKDERWLIRQTLGLSVRRGDNV